MPVPMCPLCRRQTLPEPRTLQECHAMEARVRAPWVFGPNYCMYRGDEACRSEEQVILRAENALLRKLLWLRHGHQNLYGDDGEMQCNDPDCMLDYKRDTALQIDAQWCRAASRRIMAQLGAIAPVPPATP